MEVDFELMRSGELFLYCGFRLCASYVTVFFLWLTPNRFAHLDWNSVLEVDSELLFWRLTPNGLAHRVCLEWLTGVELQISSLSNLCK